MSIKKRIKYGNDNFGKACQTIDCGFNGPSSPKKKRSWVGRIAITLMTLTAVHFFNGGFAGESIESIVPYVIFGIIAFIGGWCYDKNDLYVFGPNQGQKRGRK